MSRNIGFTPPASYIPPISAGRFAPADSRGRISNQPYGFIPSEEAQNIVDEFRKRGLALEIRPNEEGTPDNAAGYYIAGAEEGGHSDPNKRIIYLSEDNPSLFTLAHEAGHALDPNLLNEHNATIQGYDKREEILSPYYNQPSVFLDKYLSTQGPKAKFRGELEAQRAGKAYYDSRNIKDARSEEDLAAYPFQYVKKGIEQVERGYARPSMPESVYSKFMPDYYESAQVFGPRDFSTSIPGDANTVVDVSDDYVRRLMSLGLNKTYQDAREDQFKRAFELADKVLGDSTKTEEFIGKDYYLDIARPDSVRVSY